MADASSRLAIVGAGPKAAAIAARARVLRDVGFSAPDVIIVERDDVGAAWAGGAGYSDGIALLCTPPERDVGFPYGHEYGAAAAQLMMSRYSWPAFFVSEGIGFASWVARGRKPPSHRTFARYLAWVLSRSGAELRIGEAAKTLAFDPEGQTWSLTTDSGVIDALDGIVLTGSGPPGAPFPGADSRVYDGRNFWSRTAEIERLLSDGEDASVAIIGSGGGAASVADRLLQARLRVPIRIIGRQPVLFARCDSFFEMKVFGDDDSWQRLGPEGRKLFLNRLNGGTVWTRVLDRLADSDDLDYVSGSVVGLDVSGLEPAVILEGQRDPIPATVVIDCRGFNTWWFEDLFMEGAARDAIRRFIAAKEAVVDDSMALAGEFPYPGLHVPAKATILGPAADNLLALGWMADRVLRRYIAQDELDQLPL